MEFAGAAWGRLFGGGESLSESERCLFRIADGGSLDEDLCEDMAGRAGGFSETDDFLEGYGFEDDPLAGRDLSTGLPLDLT